MSCPADGNADTGQRRFNDFGWWDRRHEFDGVVTFTVTDTVVESVTYTATDASDGVQITRTATVTFTLGNVSASQSTVERQPNECNGERWCWSDCGCVTFDDYGYADRFYRQPGERQESHADTERR